MQIESQRHEQHLHLIKNAEHFPLQLSNYYLVFVQLCELTRYTYVVPSLGLLVKDKEIIRNDLSQLSTWATDVPREALGDISTY